MEPATATSAKVSDNGMGIELVAEQEPPPPTFGKSSLIMLAVAVAIYAYQTDIFRLWSNVVDRRSAGGLNATLPGLISTDFEKRDQVVEAFKYAWAAYERDAMGCDEYKPLTKTGSNLTDQGGVGYTVVDSLDTMQIMGLDKEYQRARGWIANKMTFDRDANFNTFEITIRVLGGLLSSYHLSGGDSLFLQKAIDLADRILPAFDTLTGLPFPEINLKEREGVDDPRSPGLISTAEASTLQLELKYLSFLTDNDVYWGKAEKVMKVIKAATKSADSILVPIFMGASNGQFMISEIRLGSRADSYYEYLLKQYLQTNKSEGVYLNMYAETMKAIHARLVRKGVVKGHTYTSELLPERQQNGQVGWRVSPKQDHLVCFLGGSLMLGATTTGTKGPVSVPPDLIELSKEAQADWKLGEALIEACVDTYTSSATGLAPEIVHFWTEENKDLDSKTRDWYIKGGNRPGQNSYDARYILRPETIESLFIAYRLTGDVKYRNYGWNIFQAIQKYCRVESGGYASLLNVDNVKSIKMDKMETFFLSETLKYLYLLFSDADVLPLDKYVFNTEAHPLPIFNPSIRTGFS